MADRYNGLLDIDDDDFIMPSPKKKFYDIVYNANRNLVEKELDEFFKKYVALENMLVEKGYDFEQLDSLAEAEVLKDMEIDNKKNSLYIDLVGKIVTQNE
jgi:hypothetical protein